MRSNLRNRHGLLRDLAAVALIALISIGAGIGINRFRSDPLPLTYRSPTQRLDAQLHQIIANPPFRITDLQTMGLAQFRQIVREHGALILDARAHPYYRQGHVPGALNLSREAFARDYRRLSPILIANRDKPIVVYCSGGDCHDSKMVGSALLSLGFDHVRVFTGGWESWTHAGLPVASR